MERTAQHLETLNEPDIAAVPLKGRILAVDPGTKKIGLAVSDETQTVARPIQRIARTSWKATQSAIQAHIRDFDAVALVIGLPLTTSGGEGDMSIEARDWARKLRLALEVPVFLVDERVTSYEAKGRLWERGESVESSRELVDSEAASIILSDFLEQLAAIRG